MRHLGETQFDNCMFLCSGPYHCPNNALCIVGKKNISSKGKEGSTLMIGLKEDMHSKLHQTRQWDQEPVDSKLHPTRPWDARASAQQTPSDKTVGCKSQCKGGKKDFNSVLKSWASRHFSAEASPCTTEYD